jgi:hypothetical protein
LNEKELKFAIFSGKTALSVMLVLPEVKAPSQRIKNVQQIS